MLIRGALYFFTAARTAVADFTGLQKIYLKAIEHRADDVLEAHALIEHSSHAFQLCQIGLQLVNVGILHASGISCTSQPPAHLTEQSVSTSTPSAHADGICSLSAK